MKRILIIDDDPSTCNLLASFLKKHHYLTDTSLSGKEALNLIQEKKFDLIFCDYILTDIRGKEMFEKIKRIQPKTSVIFITGHASVQIAVDLMKAGAFYYLEKPLFPEKILELMQYAFESNEVPETASRSASQADDDSYVKGVSSASEMLYSNVSLIAPTNYSVIICGETGTGKERLARQIHLESKRAHGPFVAVDCGSLSKELAASELFGHEKGAFTGAIQNKTGAFEMADGGTLFLDEIGNLSYDVQAMLLRAIQEKQIRKVGSSNEKPVNTRIIVASNKNLYDLVREQRFREDLFHRLNEFTIVIPPLKEREDDLGLFVESFIAMAEKELDKKILRPTASCIELLGNYPWPGNVRELKNFIKRVCLLTPAGTAISETLVERELDQLALSAQVEKAEAPESEIATDHDLKNASQKAEYRKIMEVLKRVQYNKTKAAALLNIDRKTLYNKLNLEKKSGQH